MQSLVRDLEQLVRRLEHSERDLADEKAKRASLEAELRDLTKLFCERITICTTDDFPACRRRVTVDLEIDLLADQHLRTLNDRMELIAAIKDRLHDALCQKLLVSHPVDFPLVPIRKTDFLS